MEVEPSTGALWYLDLGNTGDSLLRRVRYLGDNLPPTVAVAIGLASESRTRILVKVAAVAPVRSSVHCGLPDVVDSVQRIAPKTTPKPSSATPRTSSIEPMLKLRR